MLSGDKLRFRGRELPLAEDILRVHGLSLELEDRQNVVPVRGVQFLPVGTTPVWQQGRKDDR
jgi:hypothetical protein